MPGNYVIQKYKMAAYGADDFVSGSELSDLSDVSEDEFHTNNLEGFNSEFEGGENIKVIAYLDNMK